MFELAKFTMRKQYEGQFVDAFLNDLYSLAEHCACGTLHNKLIHNQIVVGVHNNVLSKRLQLDTALTLESAVHDSSLSSKSCSTPAVAVES